MNTERFAANKLEGVTMSAIRTITERARAIAAQGHEVALFSMGEPDFDTPAPIKEATKRKLDENRTHYTSNRGALALRKAIAEKELCDCALSYDPENEILLTNSGAEAINNALTAFIDPRRRGRGAHARVRQLPQRRGAVRRRGARGPAAP